MEPARGEDAALRWLLDAYRAVLPVKPLVAELRRRHASAPLGWTSLECQDAVMRVVIRDETADKFAPPRSYTYRFLKTYMDAIESVGGELSDDLVAELMEFVAMGRVVELTSADSDEMHHVTYRVPSISAGMQEDVTVTCRVASVFNEVGLKIWEAGWFLAEYVLAHRELFTDRSVLELGAGVGITGIIMAKCIRLSRVVMSDYAPKVMLNLRYNTEINGVDGGYVCPVEVETIDWDTWDPEEAKTKKSYIRPDILLAGDCVYDVSAFPSLVSVLQAFLGDDEDIYQADNSRDSDHQARRIAIFAATIRNQATFQTFLDTLAQQHITYEDITSESVARMDPKPMFPYDNREQIRLCKLYRTVTN